MMATKFILKNTMFIIPLLFSIVQVNAATRTAVDSGVWMDVSIWDGGASTPNSMDDIIINNNKTVTVQNGDNITVLTLAGSNMNNIIIDPGGMLTITGLTGGNTMTIIVDGTLIVNGDIEIIVGLDLIVTGTLIVNGNIDLDNNANLTVAAGGNMTVTGNVAAGNNLILEVDGNLQIDGNLTAGMNSTASGTGTVNVGGTITGPPDFVNSSLLPVSLLYFKASVESQNVLLSWATASEINNDFFTIEKSTDGIRFWELANVKGAGNSLELITYQWRDKSPFSKTYYRLSQTDFDGTKTFFDIIQVSFGQREEVEIFPTVIGDGLFYVSINEGSNAQKLALLGADGKIYFQTNVQSGVEPIQLTEQIQSGMYMIRVTGKDGVVLSTQKVFVK